MSVAGEDLAEILGHRAVLVEVLFVDDLLGAAHALAIDVADDAHPGVIEVQVTAEVPGRCRDPRCR